MLLEHERYYGLGMDAPVTVCSWNTNVIMVWAWMLSSSSALQHECHFGLGMDATVTVCSWNTNVIMVWAWMLQRPYAPGTLTSEHERCMVWGIRCIWFGEWMLWPAYALETRTFFVVSACVLWLPCAPGHKRYYCLGALGQKRYYGLGD